MKKLLILLFVGLVSLSASAQKDAKASIVTEIEGDIVLVYNAGVDPTQYSVNVKVYVGNFLFGETNIYVDQYGMGHVDFSKSGKLHDDTFEVIVTVNGNSHSSTGELQPIPSIPGVFGFSFGTAIGFIQ